MLKFLAIKNFVIVSELELEFSSGFTALTGETGAGKSILLDALSLVLGDRADASMIRAGCDRAELCAEFDISALPALQQHLQQQALDADDRACCLMRRVLDASGRSRGFINGHSATLSQLREIGELLLNIHGQHAHQSLMRNDSQRGLLDDYAGLPAQVNEVSALYRQWQQLAQRRLQLTRNVAAAAAECELLQFQKSELEALAFDPQEWQLLQENHARAAHASALLATAEFGVHTLDEADYACLTQLNTLESRLQESLRFDASLQEVLTMLNSAQAELQEVVYALRHYQQKLDIDPRQLRDQESRIQSIMDAARKHRVPPESLKEVLSGMIARLAELGAGVDLLELEQQEQQAKQSYFKQAQQLSLLRQQAAQRLGQQITDSMQLLAMQGGSFKVELLPQPEGTLYGLENIDFQVSANPGVPARSINKVASGGELSRISLAIQVATSQLAAVPTLIFDEVDTGIGGRVAEIVGQLLKQLGRSYQVLCVTHLPQVAAAADQQWQVSKSVSDGYTRSQIRQLDTEQRIEELARMLGGLAVTTTTRQHATEMLNIYTATQRQPLSELETIKL